MKDGSSWQLNVLIIIYVSINNFPDIMVSVFLAKKMALSRQGQQAQLANNPRFFRGGGITYNLCQKYQISP